MRCSLGHCGKQLQLSLSQLLLICLFMQRLQGFRKQCKHGLAQHDFKYKECYKSTCSH